MQRVDSKMRKSVSILWGQVRWYEKFGIDFSLTPNLGLVLKSQRKLTSPIVWSDFRSFFSPFFTFHLLIFWLVLCDWLSWLHASFKAMLFFSLISDKCNFLHLSISRPGINFIPCQDRQSVIGWRYPNLVTYLIFWWHQQAPNANCLYFGSDNCINKVIWQFCRINNL